MREFYMRNRRDVNRILLYGGFILFVYFFVTVLFDYVAPFVFGFLLSVILEPLISFLNKRLRIGRGILGFLSIILVIFLFVFAGSRIFLRIAEEAQAFAASMPYYIRQFTVSAELLQGRYANILELIPDELHETVNGILPATLSMLTSTLSSMVRNFSTSFVLTVPGIFMGALLTLISTFFFVKDREIIHKTFWHIAPKPLRSSFDTVKQGLFGAIAGYIRAQAILMSVTGAIALTGLSILQYPFAMFMGLLIAFVDALPIFGSGFILWPWALFSAVTGEFQRAIGLMIIYGVITVTRQSLEPKVLGTQIGVYPLITLSSMFVGLKVFGPLGFLIGPFIVITIKALNAAAASGTEASS